MTVLPAENNAARIGRYAHIAQVLSSTTRNAEQWLARNSTPVVLTLMGVGLVVRVYYAHASYLNPDEALHVVLARAQSWRSVYRHSLAVAHPPLSFLVEHLFSRCRSELAERSPSIAAGTVALWFGYQWLARWTTPAAALLGVVLLAFSPAMISGATEIRGYALLQLGICGALYSFERMWADGSRRWGVVFAAFLYLAILSVYGAVWFIVTLGVLGLIRLWHTRAPRRLAALWIASQCGAAALYLVLYVTHLAHLHGSTLEAGAYSGYLRPFYFQPDQETVLGFLWSHFVRTFRYLMGKPTRGQIAMTAYLVAVAAFALRSLQRDQAGARLEPLERALQLTLPFALGVAGAILHVLPFGGSRHVTYVFPFALAGTAIGFATLVRSRWMVLVTSVIAVPLWLATTTPDNDPRCFSRPQMVAALHFIRQTIAPGSLLITDGQTSSILVYYLDDRFAQSTEALAHSRRQLGKYRMRVADTPDWHFEDERLRDDVTSAARAEGVRAGDPVWVLSARWELGKPAVGTLLPTGAMVARHQFACFTALEMRVGDTPVLIDRP
ncbi:MAG TPA: glycosyltransferase family 39 protein [Candidatus Binatia bacterium]|nr:glycosyltransferase family 39 protein [Candidatus Binatia bacterium]